MTSQLLVPDPREDVVYAGKSTSVVVAFAAAASCGLWARTFKTLAGVSGTTLQGAESNRSKRHAEQDAPGMMFLKSQATENDSPVVTEIINGTDN
jgi:hypothetical protein